MKRPNYNATDNDTLQGRLRSFERDEEKHLRNTFGYWHMVEKRMIREQLIAEGHNPADVKFGFLVQDKYQENHKNDISLRDAQALKRDMWQSAVDTLGWWNIPSSVKLSREELQFLADHFDGANDPIAQAILQKVKSVL